MQFLRKIFLQRSLYLATFVAAAGDTGLDLWRLTKIHHITPTFVLLGDIAVNVTLTLCLGALVHYLYFVVPKGIETRY